MITAAQTHTSAHLKFTAFVLADQNELHVWDTNAAKARCLARLKPADLLEKKQSLDAETRFTAVCFSAAQEHIVAVGLSSGHFALYDCSQTKTLRSAKLCETAISALAFHPTSLHQVFVASIAKLQLVQISPKISIMSVLQNYARSAKNAAKKGVVLPADKLSVVKDEKAKGIQILSVDKKGHVTVTKLASDGQSLAADGQAIWTQQNAHTQGVKAAAIGDSSQHVATCSTSEATLWSLKEADEPLMLLDEPSLGAFNALQSISFERTHNANQSYVMCVGSEQLALYEVSNSAPSNRVKACDCRVNLNRDNTTNTSANIQSQILACKIESEHIGKAVQVFATIIFGNLYRIEKKRVPLGKVGKMMKNVTVADTPITSSNNEETKGAAADYHVAGIEHEDAPMTAVTAQNLRLLPSDVALDNIESRLTSVSLGGKAKKPQQPGASLTNVLRQALQSEDVDQLDWVMSQSDAAVVEATLTQLSEREAIAGFFRLVLTKFQQERSVADQLSVLVWLKTLLRLHWALIVQMASPKDLATLSHIQSFIQRKTSTMDKLMLLKGKLEMAKRTIQLQKTSFVKKLIAGKESKGAKGEVLVYKDAPDGDSSDDDEQDKDENMADQDDSDDEGMSDGSDDMSSEEEIKEIPLKKLAEKNMKKRARHGDDFEDESDSGSDEDRSESEDEEPLSKKQRQQMGSSDDEDDGEAESDEEKTKKQIQKLASSDSENEDAQMDDDDSESDDDEQIKA